MILAIGKKLSEICDVLRDDRSPLRDRVGNDVLIASAGTHRGGDRFDIVPSRAQARE